MTTVSVTTVPVPSTVSEQAGRWLATTREDRRYPPADDAAAWLAVAERANSSTARRFPVTDFPVDVEHFDLDGVSVFAGRPHGVVERSDEPLFLWFHPGAFLVGGGPACRATTGRTAALKGLLTWGVDYRTPPRHAHPAALDDATSVYRRVVRERDPSRVFVGGDSAGANIAAALLLRARAENLPMPAALVLNSPAVDLTEAGDTFRTLADVDKISSPHDAHAMYAAGADLTDPYVSPLFGDLAALSTFPPTFLQSGTRDTLLSSTVRMHRRLRAAGVAAELHVFEAMPHGGFGGDTPEDRDHAAEQRRFLAAHGA